MVFLLVVVVMVLKHATLNVTMRRMYVQQERQELGFVLKNPVVAILLVAITLVHLV
jgi:hypothetical protein